MSEETPATVSIDDVIAHLDGAAKDVALNISSFVSDYTVDQILIEKNSKIEELLARIAKLEAELGGEARLSRALDGVARISEGLEALGRNAATVANEGGAGGRHLVALAEEIPVAERAAGAGQPRWRWGESFAPKRPQGGEATKAATLLAAEGITDWEVVGATISSGGWVQDAGGPLRTATLLREAEGESVHGARTLIANEAFSKVSVELKVKAEPRGFCSIWIGDKALKQRNVLSFDLLRGRIARLAVVEAYRLFDASIEPAGGGWFRIQLRLVVPAGEPFRLQVNSRINAAGGMKHVGDPNAGIAVADVKVLGLN